MERFNQNVSQDRNVDQGRETTMPASQQKPRSAHRVFRGLLALCLLALAASSCTKNGDDTECTGCDDIVIDDTLILLESSPEPDTTNIVIDDTLIL